MDLSDHFSSLKGGALSTAVLAVALWVLFNVIGWFLSRNKPPETQRFWRLTFRNAGTVCFFIGLVLLWPAELQSVLVALGAATAGLLITFKEVWMSLLSFWFRFVKR